MLWLIIATLAYFILAVIYLFDKYLLRGLIPNSKVFAFYVGILGGLSFILIPFVEFYVPEIKQVILALLAGSFFIYGLFWFYKGLRLFEASRIVPVVGGLSPLFSFGLIYLFSFGKATLSLSESIAFILLVCGSVFITLEKDKSPCRFFLRSGGGFKLSALAAFSFSLSFVLTKYVYLVQSFWNGFIWMRIGGFLTAFVFFLFSLRLKKKFSRKESVLKRKLL